MIPHSLLCINSIFLDYEVHLNVSRTYKKKNNNLVIITYIECKPTHGSTLTPTKRNPSTQNPLQHQAGGPSTSFLHLNSQHLVFFCTSHNSAPCLV